MSRRVREWSTLVDPGVPIPPAIVALTGITDAMVRGRSAVFARSRSDVAALLDGCVFVAHNARFDYGFLKHEFARARARVHRARAVHGAAVAPPVSAKRMGTASMR